MSQIKQLPSAHKKHKSKDPAARAEARYKSALQKIRASQPITRKEFRELVRRGYMLRSPGIIKRNEKLKKEKIITTIKTTNKASTFFYSPKTTKTNTILKKSSKKPSSTAGFNFDSNDPVSEFKARNVEFGHGRKKSQEWNDAVAKNFQKELEQIRKEKPDWTDRFALK